MKYLGHTHSSPCYSSWTHTESPGCTPSARPASTHKRQQSTTRRRNTGNPTYTRRTYSGRSSSSTSSPPRLCTWRLLRTCSRTCRRCTTRSLPSSRRRIGKSCTCTHPPFLDSSSTCTPSQRHMLPARPAWPCTRPSGSHTTRPPRSGRDLSKSRKPSPRSSLTHTPHPHHTQH